MAVGVLLKQLRSSGKKYGIHFSNMSLEANSRNALLVQLLANEKDLAHAYSNKVYKSFFDEEINISLVENVIDIGLSVGLDSNDMMQTLNSKDYLEQLKNNLDLAKSKGIIKFPTFVINDEHVIAGSPNEKKFRALLESL